MKAFLKKKLRPLRKIITKLIVEPECLNNHINGQIWHNTSAFLWAVTYVIKNQIIGDYLEFGVWKGKRFQVVYNLLKTYSSTFYGDKKFKRKQIKNPFDKIMFHAFDSFEGLPASNYDGRSLQYFKGSYRGDIDTFKNMLRDANVDLNRVTITKGWFNQALNQTTAERIKLEKISIAFIDCNLYESAVPVLKFITPYLQTGTVLIIDDWYRNKGNPLKGVQGAVLEWLKESSQITLQHFYTSDTKTIVFIVHIGDYPDIRGISPV